MKLTRSAQMRCAARPSNSACSDARMFAFLRERVSQGSERGALNKME